MIRGHLYRFRLQRWLVLLAIPCGALLVGHRNISAERLSREAIAKVEANTYKATQSQSIDRARRLAPGSYFPRPPWQDAFGRPVVVGQGRPTLVAFLDTFDTWDEIPEEAYTGIQGVPSVVLVVPCRPIDIAEGIRKHGLQRFQVVADRQMIWHEYFNARGMRVFVLRGDGVITRILKASTGHSVTGR